MPITEEKALEILQDLIKNPTGQVVDIPAVWAKILDIHAMHFHAPQEPKKKRKKSANPNIGWPAGVKRAEYKAWKAAEEVRGVTENLSPQAYRRLKEAGSAA